jgi:Chemotaxis protein histidine kinase and related kinases
MYHLIVVGVAEKKLGILVDSVISSEEVAVKTISGIKKATGIAGATISADGEPILVVDIYSILKFLEDGGIDSRRLI